MPPMMTSDDILAFPDRPTFDRNFQIGRDNWQTIFTPPQLQESIFLAAEYHRGRESWWKDEGETVKTKIPQEGLQVHSQQVTGGERHEVTLDPVIMRRLTECETKERTHRTTAETLEQWGQLLDAFPPDIELRVTAADAIFFEIGKHQPNES